MFVAFEGGEGAGKSTQVAALAELLRARDHEVVETYEPGDTRIGPDVRRLVLGHASAGLSATAEALLYAADRAEHVESVIRPALARGAVVLTDRYVDSSLAYQGAGRPLDYDAVAAVNAWATGGLLPDLTMVLDLDPAEGLLRAGAPTGWRSSRWSSTAGSGRSSSSSPRRLRSGTSCSTGRPHRSRCRPRWPPRSWAG